LMRSCTKKRVPHAYRYIHRHVHRCKYIYIYTVYIHKHIYIHIILYIYTYITYKCSICIHNICNHVFKRSAAQQIAPCIPPGTILRGPAYLRQNNLRRRFWQGFLV
jgi:hypothetical protein